MLLYWEKYINKTKKKRNIPYAHSLNAILSLLIACLISSERKQTRFEHF